MADILPDDILENFLEQLPTFGIEFDDISFLTPTTFMNMIVAELMPLVMDVERDYSVDYYIHSFAAASGKPVLGLNDIFTEFELLFDIPLEIQAYALEDFPDLMTMLEVFSGEFDLIDAYESQDRDAIRASMATEPTDNPYVLHHYHVMYLRGRIFADAIAGLLRATGEPTTFFVTIGFAHIIGGDFWQVLYLLEEKGFDVVPIWK